LSIEQAEDLLSTVKLRGLRTAELLASAAPVEATMEEEIYAV
jgi:hypothetical protein